MRIVFIGSGAFATATANRLLKYGHDVIIIERDEARIREIADTLSCGFIHGDGSTPAILREAEPKQSDVLFCLTGNDQTNILASLVGRTLGFKRVITKIEDPEYEHMCIELGLEELIIPTRTISRYLVDMMSGQDTFEISSVIKNDVRVFSFIAHDEDAGPIKELKLPVDTRAIILYRGDKFEFIEDDTIIIAGDEIVMLTHSRHLPELREMWSISSRK